MCSVKKPLLIRALDVRNWLIPVVRGRWKQDLLKGEQLTRKTSARHGFS